MMETPSQPGTSRVDAMTCPHCGEALMVEYDPAIRRWFCEVCGRLSVVLVKKKQPAERMYGREVSVNERAVRGLHPE